MTVSVETLLKVIRVCEEEAPEEDLISLVLPKKGGGSAQIYLTWVSGKSLKDYIRDTSLRGVFSLHTACYSRILDQNNIKRRLTHVPNAGDEIRFIKLS